MSMERILRALAVWVGIYLACFALFAGLWLVVRPEGSRVPEGAMLGGTIALWFAVQFGRAAWRRLREALAVTRGDGAAPRDGELTVVSGTLQCASPLVSPFTGVPAVSYTYRAWRNESGGVEREQTDTTYWWGEGSVPCTLVTRHGRLSVLSRPCLDSGSDEVGNTERVRAAFTEYRAGQATQVVPGGLMLAGFEWDAPLDGPLRRDKGRDIPAPPLDALTLEEAVVSPGEPVTLIGRYSAARGGLLHDEPGNRPLRLLKGDPAAVRGQLGKYALGYGVAAVLALSGAIAAMSMLF